MRYKTGDKVEVMNNKEVPVSWWPAKILSRSSDTYTIQYSCYPGMANKRLVEIVSRKLVRPCPSSPQGEGVKCFMMGDIVEVFHENSWKIAVVLNILRGNKKSRNNKIRHKVSTSKNQYIVRLLGCLKELAIDRSKIRMRQTWHDGTWILSRKVPQLNSRSKYQPGEDYRNTEDEGALREYAVISSKSLKRISPYVSSIVEANDGHVQKYRAAEKEHRKQQVVAEQVLEKVHAVACPKETLGETYMHASDNIKSHGYDQTKMEKQNDVLVYSGVRGSELNNSDSDACSVGSCSVTNQNLVNYYNHSMPVRCEEANTLRSDAESSYGSGSDRESSSFLPKEEVEVSIHSLELHAYRSTLEALYASGPLSWDQEAMLTNLRIMLHISNDEHLKELKHLISTKYH